MIGSLSANLISAGRDAKKRDNSRFSLDRKQVTYGNQSGAVMALLLCNKIEKGTPMETIISACISAGVTLLVCMISNHSQQEKTRALMEYKLEELTKKVEKHNSVVERTFILEEKMKVANHRIEDLEKRE